MPRQAKRLRRQTPTDLAPQISAGVPAMNLERRSLAVFRDELRELLPADESAEWPRAESFTLEHHTPGLAPRHLHRRALHHGHCHREAVMHTDADQSLARGAGVELQRPKAGCCAMAGTRGFAAHRYDVAVAVGERARLPAVRDAPADTLILADGFSCREQIRQCTDRLTVHLAELLAAAVTVDPGADGG